MLVLEFGAHDEGNYCSEDECLFKRIFVMRVCWKWKVDKGLNARRDEVQQATRKGSVMTPLRIALN